MRKTIKITALILAIILGLNQLATTVYAMSEDTSNSNSLIDVTPPSIVSVSTDKTMLKPGETITFSMEGQDDMSGAKSFYVEWVSKQDPNKTLHKQFDEMMDIGTYEYTIPEQTMAGEWQATTVGLYDNQNNSRIYNREESTYVSKFDFSVVEVGQDITPPVVSNVKRITNSVTAPGKVIFQYDVTDDQSGVNATHGGYCYSPAANLNHISQAATEQIDEDTFQATILVNSPYEKFVFRYFQVGDNAGNSANYTYADLGLTNELDIIPTNYIEDNTPPTLLSVEYHNTELYIPDYLEVTLDVEDEGVGLDSFLGWAYIKSEDGSYLKSMPISKKIDENGISIENKGYIRVDFGDGETFRGKLYIDKIELQDKIGNIKTYSVENGNLDKKEITIKKIEKTYTLTTRTTKTGYIDEIANLPEGSTVLCDVLQKNPVIEKELFDIIKGKDITVTFMSLYDGNGQMTSTSGEISSTDSNIGMQWIINGKDVVNETKDVDMVIKIAEKQYSKYIISEYKLNEKLEDEFWKDTDWESMTEEKYEKKIKELAQLQKQELTRYFDSLKADGYVGTDEICAKAIKLIEEEKAYYCKEAIVEAGEHVDYISLEFAENGVLPCKTLIRIKPHFALRALIGVEDLKVYFVEGDKYSLIEDNIDLDLEKYYNFTVTHNSEYVLANGEFEKLLKIENNVPGGEGNMGNADDTNKDDTSKDDASKDDANKDDASKDDASKDDTSNTDKKDETTTDNQNKEETNNNNKLDETPNTGSIEIISIISVVAVISLAGIIILKRK